MHHRAYELLEYTLSWNYGPHKLLSRLRTIMDLRAIWEIAEMPIGST